MKKVVSGGPANRTALQEPCRPFGYNLMKKVVSGGPANRTALQEPCRPFGYNLVELSRFADAGLFGI